MDNATPGMQDEVLVYKRVFELLSENTQEYDNFLKFIETSIIPNLPSHRSLLDIGAGRGNLTRPLSFYFEQTTVVEPNKAFFDELMDWAHSHSPNVVGHNAGWETLDLDLSADLIILSHVLYYVPIHQHLEFIRKAYSHLRPGGCMILALNGTQSDIWKLCKQLYTPEEFAQLPYAERLFESMLRWNFRATYHPFHSTIDTQTETDMRSLIDFLLLGKVSFDNDVHINIRETYLRNKLRNGNGYRIASSGGLVVVTKPMEQ
ncbi:MAG: class I SAM-dependent methyltransferase [Chloroflexi bacterium]|nr:class I SAM-dependent methyltransferase [Chloroflexota bacterium]